MGGMEKRTWATSAPSREDEDVKVVVGAGGEAELYSTFRSLLSFLTISSRGGRSTIVSSSLEGDLGILSLSSS